MIQEFICQSVGLWEEEVWILNILYANVFLCMFLIAAAMYRVFGSRPFLTKHSYFYFFAGLALCE